MDQVNKAKHVYYAVQQVVNQKKSSQFDKEIDLRKAEACLEVYKRHEDEEDFSLHTQSVSIQNNIDRLKRDFEGAELVTRDWQSVLDYVVLKFIEEGIEPHS